MRFKLHIRGRADFQSATAAKAANLRIQSAPIRGIAGFAANDVCNSAPRFALPSCTGLAIALSDNQINRHTELESQRFTDSLLGAAMRCCDFHGDGEQARSDMRQQCLETPLHLRADLLDYFNTTYGEKP